MASAERRYALITGTNRGTGLAIATALRDQGYRIASLNRTLRDEPWLGERQCDLADPDALADAVADVLMESGGRLDVCVANSVVRHLSSIAVLTREEWDSSLAVNLSSVLRLIQRTLPAVRAARGLYVVMGSHAGQHFFEGGVAYSATKAALKAVVETLLIEERVNHVRATLLSPGAIANLPGDDSDHKMAMSSVAECVRTIVGLPPDAVVGELELRPSSPLPNASYGLDRLLYI